VLTCAGNGCYESLARHISPIDSYQSAGAVKTPSPPIDRVLKMLSFCADEVNEGTTFAIVRGRLFKMGC
jgi:hypothetical protein